MKKQVFLSKNAVQTQKFAAKIAEDLVMEKGRKKALVLALAGELGGGKTTFVQGLAKALGIKEKILSPTFVIMKKFKIKKLRNWEIGRLGNLYHIDCYRLDDPKDLVSLGFKEIIKYPQNLVVIEWADKVKSLIPKNIIWLEFEWLSKNQRKIYKF